MKFFYCLALIFVSLGLTGCFAHSTQVYSDPQGAKVYVNAEFVGKTPCVYNDDRKLGGDTFTFKVTKEGYKTVTRIYKQKMNTDETAISAGVGVFLCAPACCAAGWSFTLPDIVNFELEKGTGEVNQEETIAPPKDQQEPSGDKKKDTPSGANKVDDFSAKRR